MSLLFLAVLSLLASITAFADGASQEDSPYAKPPAVFQREVKPPPRIPLDPPLRPVSPEEVTIGPVLETLDGIPAVMVRGQDNQVRTVRQGEMLVPGDSFQTGPKGSARVAFEHGVQVLVASDTTVTVHGDEVPTITLSKGEVRSVVETGAPKEGEPAPSPNPADKPYKFFIRTRSAVMGVRGTDFVVQADDDKAVVHTLTGIVDVGRDQTEVKTAQGVPVPAGNYSQAEFGHRPVPAEHYDMGEFLRDFNGRNPKMEELWNSAARDAVSGRLKERFRKLREQRSDETNRKRGLLPSVLDRGSKDKARSGPGERNGAAQPRKGKQKGRSAHKRRARAVRKLGD